MTISQDQQDEIDRLRATTYTTRRATVPALEEILYQPIPVLDHGFLRCIDYAGDDAAIVQGARTSYGQGTKKVSEDAGLIRYLMRMGHSSPFELAEIKLHLKLPIFVARQLVRTRTANLNEISGRYSVLDTEFYLPARSALAQQSTINNQGRGAELSDGTAQQILDILKSDAEALFEHYGQMLDSNLARELARINLPLSTYTQMYWKIDLSNLMKFLYLRTDSHAQYEIRVYADVMMDILERWVPLTAAAFREYRLGGAHLSATGLSIVRRMIAGESVSQEDSGLSKREWRELMEQMQITA